VVIGGKLIQVLVLVLELFNPVTRLRLELTPCIGTILCIIFITYGSGTILRIEKGPRCLETPLWRG
jgi:hypothetical protein